MLPLEISENRVAQSICSESTCVGQILWGLCVFCWDGWNGGCRRGLWVAVAAHVPTLAKDRWRRRGGKLDTGAAAAAHHRWLSLISSIIEVFISAMNMNFHMIYPQSKFWIIFLFYCFASNLDLSNAISIIPNFQMIHLITYYILQYHFRWWGTAWQTLRDSAKDQRMEIFRIQRTRRSRQGKICPSSAMGQTRNIRIYPRPLRWPSEHDWLVVIFLMMTEVMDL